MQQFLTNCFSIKEQNKMIIKTKLKILLFQTFPSQASRLCTQLKKGVTQMTNIHGKEIKILSHFRLKWFQLKWFVLPGDSTEGDIHNKYHRKEHYHLHILIIFNTSLFENLDK